MDIMEKAEKYIAEAEHKCEQCGKDMGNEWLLGPVCGKCVRANHAKATGGKVTKGKVTWKK